MAVVMATDMSLGMGAWMRYRGHSWRSIAEMSAAMYLPFAVFLPLVWADVMSGGAMLTAGHLLMLPTMLALMLWRARLWPASVLVRGRCGSGWLYTYYLDHAWVGDKGPFIAGQRVQLIDQPVDLLRGGHTVAQRGTADVLHSQRRHHFALPHEVSGLNNCRLNSIESSGDKHRRNP